MIELDDLFNEDSQDFIHTVGNISVLAPGFTSYFDVDVS